MNFLRRFMAGRYGGDQLNLALVVVSLLLSIVIRFIPVPYLSIVSYAPLIWSVYRMLSRNLVKRRAENERFLRVWHPVTRFFTRTVSRLRDKTHRYYACPKCRQTCRVPKGRGKIAINCPKCGTRFVRNT